MAGLVCHALPQWGESAFAVAPGLAEAVRAFGPDVIETSGLWTWTSVAAISARAGVPEVITPRGMLEPWALARSPRRKAAMRRLVEERHFRGAAAFRALTMAEARSIRAAGVGRPIAVIPNGVVVPPEVSPRIPRADGLRTLLFLGRLHEKKGLLPLVEAACRSAPIARRHGWRVRIVGWDDGAIAPRLRAAVEGAGASDVIGIEGPAFGSDRDRAFADAHAFVLPSLSEGHPMAALEAMACGLPALLSPACALGDAVAAGAALPAPPEPGPLAHALGTLFALPPARLAEMGRAARALVVERYSAARTAERLASLYAWLAAGGAPPDDLWSG